MPRDKLEEIINDFRIEDFSQFFRLKTQPQGNFRLSTEKLPQYNDSDFSGLIKLGQIEFSVTDKLIVIGAEVKKDLSERSGKKNQYEKAKKILREQAAYSAGIFIFYDAFGNFRFSLVYPEAVGRRREWSNFRRFTYFVSKEFTNKTFLLRIGDGDFSTLNKIKDAFSVEKVTKEFYLEYRKLFEDLLNELSKNHTFKNEASRNNLNPENFAKKLLGQIVFLYFVQKKGWLGVPSGSKWGEGNKNFMGDLFREAIKKNANFYNDYLEKLFYNVLNNPRRNSVDPSFSKDFNCRIPFLNGGLFEAEYDWEESLMCLNNNIFQEIFDVFERYNFTIEEESPDDKEVAVDPEMLGQVFENLLPENLRKGKGTYYTPRGIVYYMCRESLINYLVGNFNDNMSEKIRKFVHGETEITKEELLQVNNNKAAENAAEKVLLFDKEEAKKINDLLRSIKICDPACGSGAFLVGMLNEIVRMRKFLDEWYFDTKINEYELKKETIQNCIYGVDIDPGAIEIAKLRLWLSLVVDYRVEDIEPLPNLDYRLMCGDSLLEEYEGVKFYNGEENEQQATLLVDNGKQEKVAELEKKVKEYFNIHDDKEKQEKRKEINDIKDWLVRSALEKRKKDLAMQRKNEEAKANMLDQKSREKYLAVWGDKFFAEAKIKEVLDDLHNPKATKPFFIWKLEFIDVFEDKKGFNVVIANPPYLSSKNIKEELKPIYEKKYNSPTAHYDIYVIFFERALQLLKEGGSVCFITSNKYFSQKYGSKIRKILLSKKLLRIINFNFKVFEATVDTCITILKNVENQSTDKVKTLDLYDTDLKNKDTSSLKGILINEERYKIIDQDFFRGLPESNFRLDVDSRDFKLRQKIHKSTIVLEDICFVIYGAVLHNAEKKVKKEDFIFSEKRDDLKPYIEGKYISRWRIKKLSYLKYSPAIHREPRYPELFENHKLIGKRIIGREGLSFLYDQQNLYTDNTVYIIIPYQLLPNNKYAQLKNVVTNDRVKLSDEYSLLFLLSIINSTLFKWLFQKYFSFGLDIYPVHIKKLPIKKTSSKEQKPFIKIVDKILTITKDKDYLENSTKQAKVCEYEKHIDQMVYKLYDLTSKEIKIIEENN